MLRLDEYGVTVPLAHSADAKHDIPAQTYAAHVDGVARRSVLAAEAAAHFSINDGILLRAAVGLAAEYHDLGKLDPENQAVLGRRHATGALPVQHTEAGTAFLLNSRSAVHAAVLVRSHHIGLPDFVAEQNRAADALRDDSATIRTHVDAMLDQLVTRHLSVRSADGTHDVLGAVQGDPALFQRVALSCLADGDHTDTATHYGEYDERNDTSVLLRPAERLASLDSYVASLGEDNERSRLRAETYAACRNAATQGHHIVSCGSPVGTGKTTAVMAYLLSLAEKHGLRRIIVVLPYTNIIKQSVEIYRKALVLAGENPELVVAELHHRADFEDCRSRQFTALWKAPIIVTTAVCFFETLSSNRPATLRRLHNLPGSAIFVDESHACLPAKLLPLAWVWMKHFASDWGCYWILASGSLSRFWQIEEFDPAKPEIPELMPPDLCGRLLCYEEQRVTYEYVNEPLIAFELAGWVATLPGPRVLILNTVQSAAAMADECANRFGRNKVEHLSTTLMPRDRDTTLNRVKQRLLDRADVDWTLIATSCIEAGVNLSFATGIREAASLMSLLQIAGRVNRDGKSSNAKVWTIQLKQDRLLNINPGMRDSSQVLLEFFRLGRLISPELCTEALQREVRLAGQFVQKLVLQENQRRFPLVEKEFRVIAADTRTVVVDKELIGRIEQHQPVTWQEIQRASVQIWGYRLDQLKTQEIQGRPGMYKWNLAYDDFLGCMRGILAVESFISGLGSSNIV